jgi:hypothetical protein
MLAFIINGQVCLFVLHMNLKYQIPTYNFASHDTFDFDNEEIHCTPIDSMIHKF